MSGRSKNRKSRKQFRHPLPPALAASAQPIVPRHTLSRITPPPPLLLKGHTRRGPVHGPGQAARQRHHLGRVTPPPPALLKGHVHRGPVRGLGQTAQPVIPGSRRIHQPPPSPKLYQGGTRRGWLDHQAQPRPVARPHRSNWPHGICVQSGHAARAVSQPGKKSNNGGGGGKPPPKPPALTAAPVIPGSRVIKSAPPLRALHGHTRRGRLPGEVIPFLLLASRRVQNPQARPQPAKGDWQRRKGPNLPPQTGMEAIPVAARHRIVNSQTPWQQARSAAWRGRVPGPTAPFLLREGRRCQGARPRPASGKVSRASLPPTGLSGVFLVGRHRLCRVFLPPGGLLTGSWRRGLLLLSGQAAQTVLFPCDVPPVRPQEDLDCAPRPEVSSDPGQRPEVEDSCPARPARCAEET